MKKRDLVGPIAGLAAVGQYIVLATAAILFYPLPFGAQISWLSDLGNALLSPRGSVYYRVAGVAGGIGLAVFFGSLGLRAGQAASRSRVSLAVASVCGLAAAASFALTGVFSIDMMPMHSWFSMANFISLGTAVAFFAIGLLLGAQFPRWLLGPSFAIWVVDVLSGVFGSVRFLEWILVGLLLIWVAAVSGARLLARRSG